MKRALGLLCFAPIVLLLVAGLVFDTRDAAPALTLVGLTVLGAWLVAS